MVPSPFPIVYRIHLPPNSLLIPLCLLFIYQLLYPPIAISTNCYLSIIIYLSSTNYYLYYLLSILAIICQLLTVIYRLLPINYHLPTVAYLLWLSIVTIYCDLPSIKLLNLSIAISTIHYIINHQLSYIPLIAYQLPNPFIHHISPIIYQPFSYIIHLPIDVTLANRFINQYH